MSSRLPGMLTPPMRYDPRKAREADDYDAFRRRLLSGGKQAAGAERQAWLDALSKAVHRRFPEARSRVTKPGLAARMFNIEVETPDRAAEELFELLQFLAAEWYAAADRREILCRGVVYQDRLDAVWEFAVDLGGRFVTGQVKLRNFTFDKSPEPSAEPRQFDRPFRPREPRRTDGRGPRPDDRRSGQESPRRGRPRDKP